MAKLRQMLAFVVVLARAAPTAFACLPNPQMTQSEMACCKKMAGDWKWVLAASLLQDWIRTPHLRPIASPQSKIHSNF